MEAQVLNNKIIDYLNETNSLEKELLRVLTYNRVTDYSVSNIVDIITSIEEAKSNLLAVLPRPSINFMADTAMGWFDNSSDREKAEFYNTEFDQLVIFMHTLGALIINNFKLWAYPWDPILKNGIDYSEEHPEYITLKVIEEVWRRVNA